MVKPSNNIYLFYGEDDFSLRRKIDLWKKEFAKKYSASAVIFFDAAELGEADLIQHLQTELSPSLFSSKKLLIIRDGLPKKAEQEKLAEFLLRLPATASKDSFVVFWQSVRPDGRLKFTKEFKAQVNVTEFTLPHGVELNGWLKAMAKNLQAEISDSAADLLAQYLGRDLFEEKKAGGRVVERKEAYDLWQASTELQKLASFDSQISPEGVRALVRPKVPDSVFSLSDNLSAGRQREAFEALNNYLQGASGDEKSAFIKVLGLLAEQFRGLMLVSLCSEQGMSPSDIAEKLGWSSGRVFIVSKNARNFSIPKLQRLLGQLLLMDYQLKTGDSSPRLLMDLFIVGAD